MAVAKDNFRSFDGKKLSFHQRLQGRVLLYLLLPALLIFGATFLYWGNQTLHNALHYAEAELVQQSRLIAKELDRANQLALNTAHTMALAQQNGLFGQRLLSARYAKAVLQQNPVFVGAYFGYEPNADQLDAQSLLQNDKEIERALDSFGRFLPYWHKVSSVEEGLSLEPLVDMDLNDYYQEPKRRVLSGNKVLGTVTDPYWYEGVQLVEFSFPIVIDGQFKGIAGVDMALSAIIQQLPQPGPDTDLLVLSAKRQVVSATAAPELLTLPLAQTPFEDLAALLETQPEKVLSLQIEGDTKKLYSTVLLASSDWLVILGRDKASVLNPVYRQFSLLLLVALLAFAIVTGVALWFTRRLNHRVQNCVAVLQDLAAGSVETDLNQKQPCSDEIGVMYQHFYLLINAGKSFEQQCLRIAGGDYSTRVMPRGPDDSLAYAINKMADQRQQAEQSLRSQTEQLLHAQRELVQAEKLASLGTLVVGVAHEVNTPVGVAVTAASHMQEVSSRLKLQMEQNSLKRSELSGALSELELGGQILSNNLQRASDLIRSFKNVAVDQASGEERHVVISLYLQDVLKGFTHQLKNTAVHVEIKNNSAEPAVCTDPGVLAQIFSNLLLNSYIHGFKNGTLSGTVFSQVEITDTEVDWLFQDNGVGMSAEILAKVFDPFFTTNRAAGGSGLGMHIVYNLVTHKLKGKISCDSSPNQGTKFRICFPLKKMLPQSSEVA